MENYYKKEAEYKVKELIKGELKKEEQKAGGSKEEQK